MTRPRLLTATEVAALTTIPEATWYAWRSKGRADVPQAIRLGSKRLAWVEAEVLAWIDAGRAGAA